MYVVALGKTSEYGVMAFQPEKSHDQKHVFQRGVLENLKSASPIYMKFGK